MSIPFRVPILLVGSFAVAVPAWCQAPVPEDPLLAGLVQEALAGNPDLRAAEAALRAARERPAQAGALADPVVSVVYTNEGWSPSLGTMPDTNLAVMVSQDLPFPGKRDLRVRLAAIDSAQAEQQLARAKRTVEASLRRAYSGLLQSRALVELTREQEELWRQIEGVARARYSVGQGNQQDVLRTQVELTRTGQALAEQEAESAIRLAAINRLAGRPAGTPLPTSVAVHGMPVSEPLDVELERLRTASPELEAARIAIGRAEVALDIAKREYKPDFGLQGGYMHRGDLDPMWQAGVSVTLPIKRKRRASAVAEAEQALSAARSRLSAVELQLRLRTEERLAQLSAAQKIALLYGEGIVPQGRMSVEAAIASYQAGRVPFISVLESLRTLYGDRATLVRALASQSQIRASLDEASLEATSDLSMPTAAETSAPAAGGAAAGGAGPMGGMSR
jgi:outer membrane protein TolC